MLQSKQQTIGGLDQKILIQEEIYGDNESNERVVTGWQNIASYPEPWANVSENSGYEPTQADQVQGLKTSTFTIRYRTDVNIKHRIIYQNEIYNILTILAIARKGFLKIVAESGGQYQETVT